MVRSARRVREEPEHHVVERIDQSQRQIGFDLGRDIDQVFLVMPWKQYHLDARSTRGQDFFADSANRQNTACERDFAGHGEIRHDGGVPEQADQCGGDGNARRWSILGHGARGDVDMEVRLLKT